MLIPSRPTTFPLRKPCMETRPSMIACFLQELAAIHSEMRQGKNGFGSYTYGGVKMFAAYAPVPDTDGWSIAVTAPQINYLANLNGRYNIV